MLHHDTTQGEKNCLGPNWKPRGFIRNSLALLKKFGELPHLLTIFQFKTG